MTTTHLTEKRAALTGRREQLLGKFDQAARSRKKTIKLYNRIRDTNEFLESLDRIEQETQTQPKTSGRRYAISSMFLHDSFRKLTADQDEQFFFITRTEVDGVMVLDQWAEFAHESRTPFGVTADTRSTHKLLIKLEQFGHKLLAHFHSHPGTGADATRLSGIDHNFQQRLESAGHIAVMAIFSRDGFIRFVRLDHEPDIEIYGEGVEKHASGIFRLTNLG